MIYRQRDLLYDHWIQWNLSESVGEKWVTTIKNFLFIHSVAGSGSSCCDVWGVWWNMFFFLPSNLIEQGHTEQRLLLLLIPNSNDRLPLPAENFCISHQHKINDVNENIQSTYRSLTCRVSILYTLELFELLHCTWLKSYFVQNCDVKF